MSEPIAQVEVEAAMMDVHTRLEAVTTAMATRAREAATAEHAYRVAFAKAVMKARASGEPVSAAEQIAVVECDMLLLGRLHADALLDSAKEAGRNARAQADTLRSINSNHRALVVGS